MRSAPSAAVSRWSAEAAQIVAARTNAASGTSGRRRARGRDPAMFARVIGSRRPLFRLGRMADERFAEYLDAPRGALPEGAHSGAAGGAACGDLVRVSVAVEDDRVRAAGADASGCGAA